MEREYRRPRLVIEEVRRKYKFLNTTGVRCNLKSDGESDYSVAYENIGILLHVAECIVEIAFLVILQHKKN